MYFYASVCIFSAMGIFHMQNLCWEGICMFTLWAYTQLALGFVVCILYLLQKKKKKKVPIILLQLRHGSMNAKSKWL